MDTEPTSMPRVILRDVDRLKRELVYRYGQGEGSDQLTARACARILGISPSTYKRVTENTMAPGNRFIAAVLDALPGTRFERWFSVTRVGGQENGTGSPDS